MGELGEAVYGHGPRLRKAFLVAFTIHVAVIYAISSSSLFDPPIISTPKPLNVKLVEPEMFEQEPRPEIPTSLVKESELISITHKQSQTSKHQKPEPQNDILITAPKPTRADISVMSLETFVKNETKSQKKVNPGELKEFKNSFKGVKVERQVDDDLSDISVLGSGRYNARVNGRVLCTIRMVDPFNDGWSADIAIINDCTPPKKFPLKIKR